ncbi:hypothetical protein FRC09_019359 [Ceratobasidium sp. 395]|nr:hypothetical protein FRC09_019359 [Ceratobasidium sp. 395]
MPAETKKRKLNAEGKVARASGSNSVAKDKNDLKTALRNCNATDFIQTLSSSLDEMPADTIRTLDTTLIPLARPDNSPKHCVRCHKSYFEASNKINSCIINCTKPKETRIPDQAYDSVWDRFLWRFPCCGKVVNNEEYCDEDNGYGPED